MAPGEAEMDEIGFSIQWHDRFLVGHPGVDADHRRLFTLMANAAIRFHASADPLACTTLLWEIVEDLARHFAAEESILEAVGFAGLAGHRNAHRALAQQAGAALSIACDGEWATALRLLSVLVLEHVALEDSELRHCFADTACLVSPAGEHSRLVAWPGH